MRRSAQYMRQSRCGPVETTGRADRTDNVALAYFVADRNRQRFKMHKDGGDAQTMVDENQTAFKIHIRRRQSNATRGGALTGVPAGAAISMP